MWLVRGEDLSIRVFDVENGMMLIAPMEDMECDRLAKEEDLILARCGMGQAILVLKYTDGAEELEEVDFIDLQSAEWWLSVVEKTKWDASVVVVSNLK